ncbi:hypothetical protein [Actinomyces sp.]|uniref:hypothetical protein n=1 Tax=Actinomyces sp. TaxID=29317 RepID=UPI0026DA9C42|nr:hypothetical protein [Actinomyces sp.]MDO4901269.1 hypothetical protein [Actinomyces sp.]
MSATTANHASTDDQHALDSLQLRTPLASYPDPASVPPGSGPFNYRASTNSDEMMCTRENWAPVGSKSAGSGPFTTDAALPHAVTWPGMPTGTGVVVSGGAYGVNTDDLTSFAATVDTAADWLEDARDLAKSCLNDLYSGVRGLSTNTQQNGVSYGTVRNGFDSPMEALLSDENQWLIGAVPGGSGANTAIERAKARIALEALTRGFGSLDDAASSLRSLATAVKAAATTYTNAESATDGQWTLVQRAAFMGAQRFSGVSVVDWVRGAAGALSLLTFGGATAPEGIDDVLQGMEMLLTNPHLDDWVNTDLAIILGLALWAQQAKTGVEAKVLENYIGQVATELDPAISDVLPDQVQVGSRMVDTTSLTPMQRVAYYLAICAERSGTDRHGKPTGVTVTPHGGQSVTVPTGVRDPFGFGTPVPAVAAALPATGAAAPQPGTVAEVIRYGDDMKGRDQDLSSGVVSVLRTDHSDGTTSWLVVVPGTTDWGSGSSNPQDLLTNLQGVSGRPTDMETAVVTAMREAGIAPGDKVGLYGHSQGAITAANIAADPAVNEQFNITNLLTAGGPTAGADLPDNVSTLHLENTADAVPALDGAATPRTATRTVVTLDTHAADFHGYPHGPTIYADAVEGITGNPQIDQWTEGLTGLTGAGESGAETTEIVFDITRDSPDTAWERVARDAGKRG